MAGAGRCKSNTHQFRWVVREKGGGDCILSVTPKYDLFSFKGGCNSGFRRFNRRRGCVFTRKMETRRIADYSCPFIDFCSPSRITHKREFFFLNPLRCRLYQCLFCFASFVCFIFHFFFNRIFCIPVFLACFHFRKSFFHAQKFDVLSTSHRVWSSQ
ncbi:Uncharacterized protein APZ42_011539 [Daphnia magna]|uniref:Uncharacterized protein n=1 Tax=Daphnia magna TaxID=35525 RepID=A0A162SRI3_9CRUS|nr:Uncharacterized protein APZ42_011539 [Daphnia magna]